MPALWLPTLWRRNRCSDCPGILRGTCAKWERVPCILTSAHRQWVKGWCPCIQTEPSSLAPPFQLGVSRSLCAWKRGTWSGAVGHRTGQALVMTASSHPQTGPGGPPPLSSGVVWMLAGNPSCQVGGPKAGGPGSPLGTGPDEQHGVLRICRVDMQATPGGQVPGEMLWVMDRP